VRTHDEAVEYLSRSPVRVRLLAALRAGPVTRAELRDRLDVARTTVGRNVDRMAGLGWIEETPEGPRLTALGAFVVAEFRDLLDAFAVGDDLAPLLERIPADEFDLDPARLADARVTVATDAQPLAPIDRVTTIRADSDSLRELSSVVVADSAEQVRERVASAGPDATVEVVLEAATVETARSNPDYRETFEAAVEADPIDVYRYDGSFPFLLALFDDRIALGVTDERGTPVALVESDEPAVRTWAERRYEAYRADAEQLG
jgi:predicted transcriptional regulator